MLTGAGRITTLVRMLILLAMVAMTALLLDDLRALFAGGLLLSLARWMAAAQAISSFGLRTRRNLYDSLVLSLAVLLLLGEQAMSTSFLLFLLAFATVVLLFLLASHVSSSSVDAERVAFPGLGASVGLGGLTIVATLFLAVFVYLMLPHNHTVLSAGPLPSRLDVTSGWPPPPTGVPEGDWAPWADFLPDRDFRATLGGVLGRSEPRPDWPVRHTRLHRRAGKRRGAEGPQPPGQLLARLHRGPIRRTRLGRRKPAGGASRRPRRPLSIRGGPVQSPSGQHLRTVLLPRGQAAQRRVHRIHPWMARPGRQAGPVRGGTPSGRTWSTSSRLPSTAPSRRFRA